MKKTIKKEFEAIEEKSKNLGEEIIKLKKTLQLLSKKVQKTEKDYRILKIKL